jgi:catechol 2,3-dioxygenase-like lactoylglutathione lyase family enzyme
MFIEHVNITVSSLQKSIDFYSKLFGFELRWRSPADDPDQAGAHVGDDRSYIAMFEAPHAGRADADYDRVGLNHFGLVVQDLARYRSRLRDMGIEPHLERDYDPGRRLYFYDPDGIEVELVEYA